VWDFDYADSFRAPSVPGVAPRDWATAVLDSGSRLGTNAFRELVWRRLLGFALTDGPGTSAGWTVERDDPEMFVLVCGGKRMQGRMVFAVYGAATSWTTVLRHRDHAGHLIWEAAQHLHRPVAGHLLRKASTALLSRPTSSRMQDGQAVRHGRARLVDRS
jgi:hypothetical protein